MENNNLDVRVKNVKDFLGGKIDLKIKKIKIGNLNSMDASIIYLEGLVNNDYLNRDLLKPLMKEINENIQNKKSVASYLCEKYISIANTQVSNASDKIIQYIKNGNVIVIIDTLPDFIVVNISESKERAVSESPNEETPRGAREGFVENIKTNISLIQRHINNENLHIDSYSIGKINKSEVDLIYIENLVNNDVLNKVKNKISNIDVNFVNNIGVFSQLLEERAYSIFPQCMIVERMDFTVEMILNGKIAIALDGTPCILIVPTTLKDLLRTMDDYGGRVLVANSMRFMRILSMFNVLFLPALYLSLIKFSTHLIPTEFIIPIVQSRSGIALSPFLEILILELIIEVLREGALRLPLKITGTIGVIGGIIVGDTAVQSKLVSPTTLLVVSISTVSAFLITNYELGVAMRVLRFPILITANIMGGMGVIAILIFICIYLFSLNVFGVPYIEFKGNTIQNFFIRPKIGKKQ